MVNHIGSQPLFTRFGCAFQAASPAATEAFTPNLRRGFIALLGLAEPLKVDFLPLTWLLVLKAVGHGATSEISETYMNIQLGFVFKCLNFNAMIDDKVKSTQSLLAQLSILAHAALYKHPNILTLEGIC